MSYKHLEEYIRKAIESAIKENPKKYPYRNIFNSKRTPHEPYVPDIEARKAEYLMIYDEIYHHKITEQQKKEYYLNGPQISRKELHYYYNNNREKFRAYIRKEHQKTKYEVLAHYSKKLSNSDFPCCSCCGEHEFLVFLTIDHITDRKNITHKKGDSGAKIYHYLQRSGYPSGYQVLCCNCNSAKTDSGACPHKLSRKTNEKNSNLKQEVFSQYAKPLRCICCGVEGIDFLTVDHIIPKREMEKDLKMIKIGFRANRGGRVLYGWLKTKKYPKGFQILCWNCNFAKGNLGMCPHQMIK